MTKINIDFDEHKSLRKVLSKFSTGVTVVTCIDKKNNPVGITVNSFSSVSLEPALISWCLGKSQPSYKEFINSEGFVVNILSKNQIDICKRFSNPCINKFKDFDYKKTDQGYPVIINSLEIKITVRNAGALPIATSRTSKEQIRILSATGSSSLPSFVVFP